MTELEALRAVDFDWAARLSDVWSDSLWDAPDLHADLRGEFVERLDSLRRQPLARAASPLGWPVVGAGGVGKTHFLSFCRRVAASQGAAFILVDMTDVRDFWETVLHGYLESLRQNHADGQLQYVCLLKNLIGRMTKTRPPEDVLKIVASRRNGDELRNDISKILNALRTTYPQETIKHQNIIRALICLNSEDLAISSLGLTWLQGQALEPTDKREFGFTTASDSPSSIVAGLSWCVSLCGPAVLAFDQLDPIVSQLNYQQLSEFDSDERNAALAIISRIGAGFGALPDMLRRTLTIISCLESTWAFVLESVIRTATDRYERARRLDIKATPFAETMVRNRLAVAFAKTGFVPPYPTWPFRPEAFVDLANDTPREILKKCEDHRTSCLRAGRVNELKDFKVDPPPPDPLPRRLDGRFEELKRQADPAAILEERSEDDRLGPLFVSALTCLIKEALIPENIDAFVDSDFPGGAATRPLHARLRLVYHAERMREEHFCVRALQQSHYRAFQSRLKSAMVQAGIDRALPFRHLSIVRTTPRPKGAETEKLIQKYQDAQGIFLSPTDDEIRTLYALHVLSLEKPDGLENWLRAARPASSLRIIQSIAPLNFAPVVKVVVPPPPPPPPPAPSSPSPTSTLPVPLPRPVAMTIPLGYRLISGRPQDRLDMETSLLEKHTAVLAGAGSGKTVALRRLVEEAVLLGIPSIVIDCANDLSTLGDAWPSAPEGWTEGDALKAEAYLSKVDPAIWTPGKESGNPISLDLLPDFSESKNDPEELSTSVQIVLESLAPFAVSGGSQSARQKTAILSRTLTYFARRDGGSLTDLVDLLEDYPAEVSLGVSKEEKLAKQIADDLRAALETNPLLRSNGAPLDPAVLFGDDERSDRVAPGKTRVSVINLIGLPHLDAQRDFINRLAMTLFAWIKKHPEPNGRPLRGLLVIDEAKDFAPSSTASVCKASLARLTAQARKYHLGMVFATQNPKDIDHTIIANCSTHYYGKLNSPAAIEAAKDLIRSKGGTGDDLPRLARGQFYVHNADLKLQQPVKVSVPLCLSRHPANPLDESAVIERAAESRRRLFENLIE